jgi:hypothetical protein
MTVALKERGTGTGRAPAGRLFDPGGGRSLDESVSAVWEGLALRGHAGCLVCGGTLARCDQDAGAEEAECATCGSRVA